MLETFQKHLTENFKHLKNSTLLVACSGGLDSVVLTHCLHRLNYTIAIAHCNFNLRGKESNGDADFVEELAEKLGLTFFYESFNTKKYAEENKLSTQMAARELRYQWFEELLESNKLDYILTAHHADDDLETFFINLSRGTGLRGLTGIPENNQHVVRPMLSWHREQILSYAKQNNLYWREDSSNASTEYLRNKIRLEVIPPFKELGKDVLQNFQKTQQHLQQSRALVEDYMALVYNLAVTEVDEGYSIAVSKISELPNTEALLYELLHPFGFTAWDDIFHLLTAQSGKVVTSPTHRLIRDRDQLLLTQLTQSETSIIEIQEGTKQIHHPISLRFQPNSNFKITNAHTVFVDEGLLQYPLTLRKWEEGDYFFPFGMKGKKKVSKFFKDEKLSLVAKEKTWLLCSQNDVVWVVGQRLDDRYKITPETSKILKISLLDT